VLTDNGMAFADLPKYRQGPSRTWLAPHIFDRTCIDNAIKHTEAGGTIAVRVAPCPAGLEFRVEDTGIGIAAADLPHIFARFYTADKARSREQGGTGLGLSIVKHIVRLHGGSVRAESTPGRGTNIILQLPLLAAASARDAVSPDEFVAAELEANAGSR